MMKVLMLDPNAMNPYGTDLACALSALGLEVVLITATNHEYAAPIPCRYIKVAPRACEGKYLEKVVEEVHYLLTIIWMILRWKPDVVHIQWYRFTVEVRLLRLLRGLGVKQVITGHNVLPHERRRGDHALYRRYYATAHRVIVHEDRAARGMVEMHGIPQSDIAVVPFGMALVPPARQLSRDFARNALGLSSGIPTFLLYGGIRPYKGFEELLYAFQEATRAGMSAQLIVAGWVGRAMESRYSAILADLDPDVRARVLSMVAPGRHLSAEETDEVFCATDCVVLPYREISQSSVLFQAFSYGRAVIATRVGGFADVVEDGQNGIVVEPDDRLELGLALRRAATDVGRLREWGSKARTMAMERHSWQEVAARTLAVYGDLVT